MTETMQDSGVEWIGAIPNGWNVERLKDVANINENSLDAKTPNDYLLKYIEISNVNSCGIVSKDAIEEIEFANAPSRAKRKVTTGDTIISSVRPNLQAVAYIETNDLNLICSTGFYVVNSKFNYLLNSKFTYYFLLCENSKQYFESVAKGVGYPAIDDKDFKSLYLTLPPIPEQQAIAQYLDERCGKLDSIIAIKKQQIQTLDALRKSIIYQAVTKGLDDSVEFVDSGVEWLGEIPKGWKVDKLKRISDIRYGLGQPPASKDDGLPMIRATDVYRGTIVGDKLLTIDPDTLPLGRNPYLKEGEIIVVRSGAYTGDSAIIPAQYAGAIAGYDMVVTVNRANSKFIAYCLLCDYVLERQLRLLMLRAAQPHLNSQELGGILLVLPKSNEEQQKIVDYLDNETQRLAQLKANLTQQIGVLLDYKKSLIYECVTGKKRVFNAG